MFLGGWSIINGDQTVFMDLIGQQPDFCPWMRRNSEQKLEADDQLVFWIWDKVGLVGCWLNNYFAVWLESKHIFVVSMVPDPWFFHGQARRQRRDHHLLTAKKVSCTKALLLFDDFGETFLIIQVSGSRPNSGVSQAAWEGPDGEVMQVKVFKKTGFWEQNYFSWTQRPWPWRRRRMGSPSSRERTISLKAAGI